MLQPVSEQEATFVETTHRKNDEEEMEDDDFSAKKPATHRNYFKCCRYVSNANLWFFFIVAVSVPTIMYLYVYDIKDSNSLSGVCVVDPTYRVSCGYSTNLTREMCEEINCCFDDHQKECFHYIPSKYQYESTSDGYQKPKWFEGTEVLKLDCHEDVEGLSVMVTQDLKNDCDINSKVFDVQISKRVLAMDVYRNDKSKLLTTSRGPLISTEDYWEWTFQLIDREKDGQIFGLGQLMINANVTEHIYYNHYDHDTRPIFLAYQKGKYHGLLVQHQGLAEILMLNSSLISVRTISGTELGFKLFPGPTFQDVINQMSNRDVFKNDFPRWTMGMHICRNTNSYGLANLNEILDVIRLENRDHFEADCIHENLFLMIDQVKPQEENLLNTIRDIKSKGKFIFPLSPHISVNNTELIDLGTLHEVFYKTSDGEIYIGLYKGEKVAFVDYTSPKIEDFLEGILDFLGEYFKLENIDGFYLIDNWPEDESYKLEDIDYTKFSYRNNEMLKKISLTLPWNMKNSKGTPHNIQHNNYGKFQIKHLQNVLNNRNMKIPIWSSTPTTNEHPILIQNVNFTWSNLNGTITKNLHNNLLGNPLISNAICGTDGIILSEIQEQLCVRWFLGAATWPSTRMTVNWPEHKSVTETGKNSMKKALELKKMLSYYQYGELKTTGFAMKPLFMDFHEDKNTWNIVDQNMIGSGLLVAYVLLPEASLLRVYLPEETSGKWFEFWGGNEFPSGWNSIYVTRDERVLFLRSGYIVPLRKDDGFDLVIAKNCVQNSCNASGKIVFDENNLDINLADANNLKLLNMIQIRNELNCDNSNVKVHPYKILSVKIYESNEDSRNYQVNYNLCDASAEDIVNIPLE